VLESTAVKSDSLVGGRREVNGGYPEYDRANSLSEGGTHSVLTLNTPKRKKLKMVMEDR